MVKVPVPKRLQKNVMRSATETAPCTTTRQLISASTLRQPTGIQVHRCFFNGDAGRANNTIIEKLEVSLTRDCSSAGNQALIGIGIFLTADASFTTQIATKHEGKQASIGPCSRSMARQRGTIA